MNKRKANHVIKETLIIGYGHYSRKEEKKILKDILLGDANYNYDKKSLSHFPLADNDIRSIKNHLISSVAVICRAAADLGADDEKCYALSDFYINEIECKTNVDDWVTLVNELFLHYRDLVNEGRTKSYSLPVTRAIVYIQQHIYEKCSLKDVANAISLHPGYLSSKFKKETGLTITDYILHEKINEAKSLLENSDYDISEIAEILGFGNISYFAKRFKKECGCRPSEFKQELKFRTV